MKAIQQREHSGAGDTGKDPGLAASGLNQLMPVTTAGAQMVPWASPVRTRLADHFCGDGGRAWLLLLGFRWSNIFKCSA